MFSRPPVFSPLVAQFDSSLNLLTWNDGNLIQSLTSTAKNAPPADVDIIAACVTFRIIMNPQGAKIPVIYLMDSITKNSGALYEKAFSQIVPTLIPAIYEVINIPGDKERIPKLVSAWMSRSAFPIPLLIEVQTALQKSDARRATKPLPTGWPAELPQGSEQLPQVELKIAEYFYSYMYPMSSPTPDELSFAKDSLATLSRLLGPLNSQLGRMHDPEMDTLLQQYEQISQLKTALSEGGTAPSNGHTSIQSLHAPIPSSANDAPIDPRLASDPRLSNDPRLPDPSPHHATAPSSVVPHLPSPVPHQVAMLPHQSHSVSTPPLHHNPAPATHQPQHTPAAAAPASSSSASAAPTISDPRTLSKYHQANINMLYRNLPHRCTTCGMRFKTNDELSAHLNWHYYDRTILMGRQGARSQKLQRQWYLSAQEWVSTCGGTRGQSIEEKANGPSAPGSDENAADNAPKIVRIDDSEHEQQAVCFACGDEIDQPEYDETGWFYPNTIRGTDGNLYHAKCAASLPSLNSSINLASSLQLNASAEFTSPNKKRSHQDSEEPFVDSFDDDVPEPKKPKLEE